MLDEGMTHLNQNISRNQGFYFPRMQNVRRTVDRLSQSHTGRDPAGSVSDRLTSTVAGALRRAFTARPTASIASWREPSATVTVSAFQERS